MQPVRVGLDAAKIVGEDTQSQSKPKLTEDSARRLFKSNRIEFGEAEIKPAALNARNLRDRNKQKQVVQKIMLNELQIKGLKKKSTESTSAEKLAILFRGDNQNQKKVLKKGVSPASKSQLSPAPVIWGPHDSNKVANQVMFGGNFVRDPSEVVKSFREDLVIRLIKNSFKQLERQHKPSGPGSSETPDREDSRYQSSHLPHTSRIRETANKFKKMNSDITIASTKDEHPNKQLGFLKSLKEEQASLRQRVVLRMCGPRTARLDQSDTANNTQERSLVAPLDQTRTLRFPDIRSRSSNRPKFDEGTTNLAQPSQSNTKTTDLTAKQEIPALKSSLADPIGFLSENNRFKRFKGTLEVRKLEPVYPRHIKASSLEELVYKEDTGAPRSSHRPQFAYDQIRRGRITQVPENDKSLVIDDLKPPDTPAEGDPSFKVEQDHSKSSPGLPNSTKHTDSQGGQTLKSLRTQTQSTNNEAFTFNLFCNQRDCWKTARTKTMQCQGWLC